MITTTATIPLQGSNINNSNPTYMYYGLSAIIPMSIILVIFMILAIGGNVMVILTVLRHRGMRTRTNMFIVNLAIADILVAIFNMPFSLTTLSKGDWIFGDEMCKFNGFTMALLLICSIHTLMYISIHKYMSITKPFSRAMNPKRIKIMIAAAWIWSFICALGPLIGWNEIVYKKGSSQCGPSLPNNLTKYTHSFVITSTNYIIPLAVMTFCYYHIFREIHDHMKRIRETSNINLNDSVSQQKRISITLFLVLACFLLCWTPFVLYSTTVAILKDKSKMPLIVNPIVYWCGYCNSACNPIIYAFRSPSFRQGYKEIMCGTYQGPIMSAGSSVRMASFRSRSLRGSNKSPNSITGKLTFNVSSWSKRKHEVSTIESPPKKRFLSQTSWISLPCFPLRIKRNGNQSDKTVKPTQETNHVDNTHITTENVLNKSNGFCTSIYQDTNKLSIISDSNKISKSCPSLQDAENFEVPPSRRKSSCVLPDQNCKENNTDLPNVVFTTAANVEITIHNETIL